MALIQKIRGMSALVLTLMFLAIFAFIGMLIMQDANPSGNPTGIFGNSTTIAKVAGQSLEAQDLDKKAEMLYGSQGSDLATKNYLFDFFVDDAILTKEAQKAGLGVCKDELIDLEFGNNPSRVILSNQALANPQTGQVDPAQLQQIQTSIKNNTLPLEGKKYWAEIEKQVIKDRIENKFLNLVDKAIYTPTWAVEDGFKELTEPVDFEYVKVPFTAIDDKEVSVSDAEIDAYIKENKGRFRNEYETRIFEYVNFPVIPTVADSTKLYGNLAALKADFRATTKDSSFVASKNGMYNDTYSTKATIQAAMVKDSLFNAPIGTVVGPYVDGKAYFLAKLIDRRNAPDSVRSRHILIRTAPGSEKTADSLKALLVANPSLWDSLNQKYSGDEMAKTKGGDLDYQPFGKFVPAYNDLIFFKAAQGPFYTVTSEFGTHIIQVTGVKTGKNEARAKIAYIREAIIPSAATDRDARDAVNALLQSSKTSADLTKNALAQGKTMQGASPVRNFDNSLGQFGQATGVRQIVRWMFEAKQGERCKEVFPIQQQGEPFVSEYVVGSLRQINPQGYGTSANASIKEQVLPIVRNRKKGELLKAKIGTVSDLAALAGQYGSKIDTARGVTFNVNFVPNLGQESKVMGAAFTTPVGSISAPIVGESGVIALKVTQKQPFLNSPVDKNILRSQMASQVKGLVRNTMTRFLRKQYDITDNRLKFY